MAETIKRPLRSTGKIRDELLAFISDDTQLGIVRQYCQDKGIVAVTLQKGAIGEMIEYLKENRSPKILLVELSDKKTALDDIDALAEVCDPDVKVITTGTINELSFYRELIDVGINDYLLQPFSAEEFGTIYEKLLRGGGDDNAEKNFIHIAVMGTRGGVGVTTVVNTLGYILAEECKLPTSILDLDPYYGTASLDLDLDPSRGFREALEKPERIDSLFMDRVLIKYSDELTLMSAEEGIEDEIHPSDKNAELLLKEFEAKCQFLVTDIPRQARKYIWTFIAKADVIIIVSDLSVAGLRDCGRYLEQISNKMAKTNIRVIINRTGMNAKCEISQSDFEDSIKRKINLKIPFESDIACFQSTGKPLAEFNAASKTLKALRDLTHEIAGQKAKPAGKSGARKDSTSNSKLNQLITNVWKKKPA